MPITILLNYIHNHAPKIEFLGLILLGIIAVFFLTYAIRPLCGFFLNRRSYQKVFLELIFPTDHGKTAQATEQIYHVLSARLKQRSGRERVLGIKNICSLEIVSNAKDGIRYVMSVPEGEAEIMRRSLISYLPGLKINTINDYLNTENKNNKYIELKLLSDFVLPLKSNADITDRDPLAQVVGHMTKLEKDEAIVFQIVLTPITASVHRSIIARSRQLKHAIYLEKNISEVLADKPAYGVLRAFDVVLSLVLSIPQLLFSPTSDNIPIFQTDDTRVRKSTNPYELELAETIKHKLDQGLFETSIRLAITGDDQDRINNRAEELIASFHAFATSGQALVPKRNIFGRNPGYLTTERLLSPAWFSANPVLSSSELATLYHFPRFTAARTEDLVKLKSEELPAPLTLKNRAELDVVFGHNHYGNTQTPIGLTDDERSRHMYVIGQTGSGKSTVIYHMAVGDIVKGRGLAVIDPHGDLAEDLLNTVPEDRINDIIYFNPYDIKYPIGINLLELPKNMSGDELELEKELVCESVISVFRRIFNKDENIDAHRIEYVLRNTIHTAFTIEDATIFTVYELLNNSAFQKQITNKLADKNLKMFWKNEFGKAGDYQIIKMVGGVTAKIGRMLFSPIAKRILEQPQSTINFEDILDKQKILICNLAEGKLGEDTSQLLGTMIIAKIHQAALRRSRREIVTRTPFYLYVDEFQNFATSSFTKLLSGGRKFGLRIVIAEQSTAQQADRHIVDVILANTGVVVCFRTASPVDEQLMLSQFAPLVKIGDIANLPRHRFFMRLAAIEAEDPFSGETFPINATPDGVKTEKIINASRINFATEHSDTAPSKPEIQASETPNEPLQSI